MNLRQKVLFVFVSEGMDTRFQYSEPLVQTQFSHLAVTGLRNDNTRNEIKPLLKDNMSDEELLEHLNKAVSDEKGRRSKMKKSVNLNKVDSTSKEEKLNKEKKENPILTELRELKVQLNEVTAMKSDIEDLKKQMNQKGDNSIRSKFDRKRFGCHNCRKHNVAKRCSHCYLCGGSDNFRTGCTSTGN